MDEFLEKLNSFTEKLLDPCYFTSSTSHMDVNEGYNEAVNDIRNLYIELGLDKVF